MNLIINQALDGPPMPDFVELFTLMQQHTSTSYPPGSLIPEGDIPPPLIQGGIAVAIILSLAFLIKSLAELVKACQD
ncbi:MAG: hypothetical protein WBA43_05160 [Elainellaceae cyanobacterium]